MGGVLRNKGKDCFSFFKALHTHMFQDVSRLLMASGTKEELMMIEKSKRTVTLFLKVSERSKLLHFSSIF